MATSRDESFRIQAFQLTDALLVWLAFWLGAELRDVVRSSPEDMLLRSMTWVLYLAVPCTPLILDRFGFYDRPTRKTMRMAVWQLVQSLVLIGLLIGMFAVFAKLVDSSRLILAFGLTFTFLLILARDRITHRILRRQTLAESKRERVIIAGSGNEIEELLAEFDPDITSRWNVVNRFDLNERTVDDLFELLKRESVERVIFSAKHTAFEKVARAVEACELQGVEAWIAASFIRTQIARPVFDAVGNKPMLVLRSTPELSWELMFKSLIDRVGATLLILLSLPLWVIAAVGIKMASPGGPVMFSQMRAGRYGKPFKMYKFRTMVPNAEDLLKSTRESHGNQMDGPVFKLNGDPRIFRFGAFLRKMSIDELPQLINVALGDMSLVGPRPLPLYEVAAFCDISHRRRLSVKPGITCEWQAGGRNKITSFDDWVKMDLKYIDNWSLWLDFRILLKTVPAVLLGTGAK